MREQHNLPTNRGETIHSRERAQYYDTVANIRTQKDSCGTGGADTYEPVALGVEMKPPRTRAPVRVGVVRQTLHMVRSQVLDQLRESVKEARTEQERYPRQELLDTIAGLIRDTHVSLAQLREKQPCSCAKWCI